ncbi:MAG: TatD family hydrolase [bacterium]|nr:TatD family hydrolase [bacterium]
MLIDSHAHTHFSDYKDDIDEVLANAKEKGVNKIITVGTNAQDSVRAINFIKNLEFDKIEVFCSIGLHPHDAKKGENELIKISNLINQGQAFNLGPRPGLDKIVAIGECGLDYYRNLSSKEDQERAFRYQIELALEHNLPIIFHVRDAWRDFFRIITDYKEITGVIHSFSATPKEVEKTLEYDLYFGLNGIMTFTKDKNQLEAAKLIPNEKLLLETDCPFLSPAPNRGKRNEPANVRIIAEFLADLRNQSFDELANRTSQNANKLFNI